jgi:hypothetical protein
MNPAEAIATADQESAETQSAAAAAAWLTNPAAYTKLPSLLDRLLDEIERGDVWDNEGNWLGQGPEPFNEEKEDTE